MFRRALILAATRDGAQVTAVGAGGDGYDKKLEAEGIFFRDAPISFRSRSPFVDLTLVISLTRYFRATQTDVCHAFTIKPAIFATLSAALARVPVRVVTITGLGFAFTSAGGLLRRVVETLYRLALHYAHVVYFQNAEDRDLFITRKLVSAEKTRLVAGSGVDIRRFQPAALPSSAGQAPTFLMIGRLLRDKGIVEFQTAATLLRARFPAARCLLLGGEDPRNPSKLDAAEIAALRGTPGLIVLEECDDVRPVIAGADVLVLPSYREGLPRSLLEGAAMGRALIATDVPGCRDVVEHNKNGLLVARADAASLADAMLRLTKEPQLIATFGAAARKLVEDRFDEQKVIDNTLATYRKLLASNSRNAKSTASH